LINTPQWKQRHLCEQCRSVLRNSSDWNILTHVIAAIPGSQQSSCFHNARCQCTGLNYEAQFQLVQNVISPDIYIGLPQMHGFSGRSDQIDLIQKSLIVHDQPVIIILEGASGSGKTALATESIIQFVDLKSSKFSEIFLYHFLASSASTFEADLLRVIRTRWREIGLDSEIRSNSEILNRIRIHFSDPHRKLIVLLENASADGLARAADLLVFGNTNVHFVVTTRMPIETSTLTLQHSSVHVTHIKVGALSIKDSLRVRTFSSFVLLLLLHFLFCFLFSMFSGS
jgi:hypothetical protein